MSFTGSDRCYLRYRPSVFTLATLVWMFAFCPSNSSSVASSWLHGVERLRVWYCSMESAVLAIRLSRSLLQMPGHCLPTIIRVLPLPIYLFLMTLEEIYFVLLQQARYYCVQSQNFICYVDNCWLYIAFFCLLKSESASSGHRVRRTLCFLGDISSFSFVLLRHLL